MSKETDPVNIGNPDEITVKEFADEVIKITGSKSKIVFEQLPIDDPKVRQPSIKKAKKVLGWGPKVDRKSGLEKTIKYFNEVLFK